ncbi:thiopeptide-type bacteriocin biosynthesis protein [Streptomyces sp. cmx-4-9]|uniref:thiopeptide-type bacteriocin biosynthesis protein n=1 Tax=Streptomyces sp. cmx-4-9 TaxID=2790941 RepID=UPI00397FC512
MSTRQPAVTTTAPTTAIPVAAPATTAIPVTAPQADTWQGFHVFLHSGAEDADAFLTGFAAPLLDGLVAAGEASAWFFIRYAEGGPHLRLRVRGLDAEAAARLPAQLARAAAEVPAVPGPWPSRHAEVRTVPYVPETDRYGGPRALPLAEEVFAHSTQAALGALREPALSAAGPAEVAAARLLLGVDLVHATTYALGLDRLTAARRLRSHASGWRWVTEVELLPGASVHSRVNSVYAARRTGLADRARTARQQLADGSAQPWLVRWVDRVRASEDRLRSPDGAGLSEAESARVWGSQLHMLLNRLGVTPDEERAVCRLAARTLLETEEAPHFFPVGHTAADIQYLERSKFQIGRGEDTALRVLPPGATGPAATATAPGTDRSPSELPLPESPLPDVSLGEVLAGRSCLRGPLTGPLDAATLGSLLWNSLSPTGTHRPYPSAGALHTARVRLLVFDVDGVPAGTYACEPERRTLRPVGPPPPLAAVQALSTYLSRPAEDPVAIGIDAAPVVLALYADLGLLRRRYGLRALRLALLETGHMAQTLLLTASALGLGGTPLGGFHDDLAHELLGLDDLAQPLQYLIPLGRRPLVRAG